MLSFFGFSEQFINEAKLVHLTDDIIGDSGYIDHIKPEHFNGSKALKGIDKYKRCFLSFTLKIINTHNKNESTVIYTIFQRYKHDSCVVFCLSHNSKNRYRFIEEQITNGSIVMSNKCVHDNLPVFLRTLETEAEVVVNDQYKVSLC